MRVLARWDFVLIILLLLFLGILNYFNLVPLSKTFPFLSFLPHQNQTKITIPGSRPPPVTNLSEQEFIDKSYEHFEAVPALPREENPEYGLGYCNLQQAPPENKEKFGIDKPTGRWIPSC